MSQSCPCVFLFSLTWLPLLLCVSLVALIKLVRICSPCSAVCVFFSRTNAWVNFIISAFLLFWRIFASCFVIWCCSFLHWAIFLLLVFFLLLFPIVDVHVLCCVRICLALRRWDMLFVVPVWFRHGFLSICWLLWVCYSVLGFPWAHLHFDVPHSQRFSRSGFPSNASMSYFISIAISGCFCWW